MEEESHSSGERGRRRHLLQSRVTVPRGRRQAFFCFDDAVSPYWRTLKRITPRAHDPRISTNGARPPSEATHVPTFFASPPHIPSLRTADAPGLSDMFSDISLDRVALYAALCGTAFGLLFGVFGMATTLSLGEFPLFSTATGSESDELFDSPEQVQFFPFFCIASGLWGVLALIEVSFFLLLLIDLALLQLNRSTRSREQAAIYLPFRREDPSTSNVFATGKKTLLLHAVRHSRPIQHISRVVR